MSRAFGNRMLKQFVVADPEIQVLVELFTTSFNFLHRLNSVPKSSCHVNQA